MHHRTAHPLILLLAFSGLATADETLPAEPVINRTDQVVTITCPSAETDILYSLDGSQPDANAGPYLAPITLIQTLTVKARAYSHDRQHASNVVSATYQVPADGHPILPSTMIPVTQGREWPRYVYATRHAAILAAVRANHPEVVFIGDSITHHFGGTPQEHPWPGDAIWKAHYEALHAVNLGYGWDRVENILWRIGPGGELAEGSPKVAVLMLGTNNVSINSPAEIAQGIAEVCRVLHQDHPQMHLLLLGIFPRGDKPNPDREKITDINQRLAKLDGTAQVTFLDIGARFLEPDQSISNAVMSDFLHPTEKGYAIWADALAEPLAKLLAAGKQ